MSDPFSHTRHSKEDSLGQREFEFLLDGARDIEKDKYSLEARFIILVAGRLGLRRGEIAHMKEEWIDWRRNMIVIPRHQPCTKGEDGGICGYCHQSAKQRLEYNPEMTYDKSESMMWASKTDEAAREVPFDFHPRVSLVIERFFDKYDEFPYSAMAIDRRLKWATENAEGIEDGSLYPHALRATAASFHAGRGLDVIPLQSLMGWAQVSTAHNYVKSSGENTQRALHYTHSQ